MFGENNKLELLALIAGTCTLTYLITVMFTSISVAVMPLSVAILIIIVLISLDLLFTACRSTPRVLIPQEDIENTRPWPLGTENEVVAGYYSRHVREDELTSSNDDRPSANV